MLAIIIIAFLKIAGMLAPFALGGVGDPSDRWEVILESPVSRASGSTSLKR